MDVSEEVNKELKHYKVDNNLNTLGEAAADILEKYFKEPKNG